MFDSIIPTSFQRYTDYMPLFLISMAISLVLTPVIGYIARKCKIVALPPSMRDGKKLSDFRHLEKQPKPLLGGIAVIAPLILLTLIHTETNTSIFYFVAALSVLLIGGVIDDIFETTYKFQLPIQFIAALLIVLSPINLEFINNPINGIISLDLTTIKETFMGIPIDIVLPGDLILLAWIPVCINAVKWVAGTDGLMEGNSFFSCFTLFVLSLRVGQTNAATISIIFAGLILGFLFFNFYPAKIHSASSGKTSYGFILAVLSVMGGAKFATALIILILPLIDFIWVIIGRIATHKPKNLAVVLAISDQTHLHHKLLRIGLTEPQIAFTEYLLSAVLGAIALITTGALNAFALIFSGIVIALLIYAISKFARRGGKNSPPVSPEKKESPEKKFSY